MRPDAARFDQAPTIGPPGAGASTDGSNLAGTIGEVLHIYSFTTESVIHQVEATDSGRWVNDSTVVYGFRNEIRLLDTASGDMRNLYTAAPGATIAIAGFSPDRRTLYLTMSSPPESDIWLLTLP